VTENEIKSIRDDERKRVLDEIAEEIAARRLVANWGVNYGISGALRDIAAYVDRARGVKSISPIEAEKTNPAIRRYLQDYP
jgi:hypothetical protein